MKNTLKYKEYSGSVSFSAEDEVFYGKVQGLNDLLTFEGESVKELKKSFQETVDDYLSTCDSLGKSPEKSYKGSFNVRISTELHRQAANFAFEKRISLNELVKKAISYALLHKNEL